MAKKVGQMLDDLKFIANRDSQDAFGVAANQAKQLLYNDLSFDDLPDFEPANVVLAGMGGSALGALICQRWWRDWIGVPFEVARTYDAPAYIGERTLFIASSYSGNTEETVAALYFARAKNAKIVIISAGGKLQELAEEFQLTHVQIPSGLQPRMAVFETVRILSALIDHVGLMQSTVSQLESIHGWLSEEAKKLEPTVHTSQNLAKQIAMNIVGKSAVIYSGPMLGPAAYKWKISLNESSKNLAWSNEFSEFNHNEIVGWTSHPKEKVFAVINLMSMFDNDQIKKRFEISNRLLSGQMPAPQIINAEGGSHIAQLLWTVQLGDFVSLYLAMLNNVDPTPVDVLEKLKGEL